jgi:hypothetical protein
LDSNTFVYMNRFSAQNKRNRRHEKGSACWRTRVF